MNAGLVDLFGDDSASEDSYSEGEKAALSERAGGGPADGSHALGLHLQDVAGAVGSRSVC